MPTSNSLPVTVVWSFAGDKWCAALFECAGKCRFLQLRVRSAVVTLCNVLYTCNLILWSGRQEILCLRGSQDASCGTESDNQDKERWSGHKGRKFDTCKEKGSVKGSERSKPQRFTQSEEKVNLQTRGLPTEWLKACASVGVSLG